jgi:5-methylcytosine-specific restriction protein A
MNGSLLDVDGFFVRGEVYRRQEIHKRFGGQEQGGMITPSKHHLIFLVTGISGRQHGYEDHWSDDSGTFFYYGEGQNGDMKFTKANLALRDHSMRGEDVHLFGDTPKKRGYLRYQGQMVCTGFTWVNAPDTNKRMRNAILFELVPIENFGRKTSDPSYCEGEETEDLAELRAKALADSAECRTAIERRTLWRMRSRSVRRYVLVRAAGKCEGCGMTAPFVTTDGHPYIEPHHIRRLTDGGPDDPRWVVGLCPNCHRRVHYSVDGVRYNQRLSEVVFNKEKELADSSRSKST